MVVHTCLEVWPASVQVETLSDPSLLYHRSRCHQPKDPEEYAHWWRSCRRRLDGPSLSAQQSASSQLSFQGCSRLCYPSSHHILQTERSIMPRLYCFSEDLPWNFIISSSTATSRLTSQRLFNFRERWSMRGHTFPSWSYSAESRGKRVLLSTKWR